MQPTSIGLALAATLFVSTPALASDFDGSKPLICAPVEAMDCTPGSECVKGTPDDIGAPAFMRIDFAKKTVAGPKRTSPIQAMETVEDQLLLRGTELGYGWIMVLDHANGKMSATLTDSNGAFVIFGSCTPL